MEASEGWNKRLENLKTPDIMPSWVDRNRLPRNVTNSGRPEKVNMMQVGM